MVKRLVNKPFDIQFQKRTSVISLFADCISNGNNRN
jgi:hypothetical protein